MVEDLILIVYTIRKPGKSMLCISASLQFISPVSIYILNKILFDHNFTQEGNSPTAGLINDETFGHPPSFRRRPESRMKKQELDPGLRRGDGQRKIKFHIRCQPCLWQA